MAKSALESVTIEGFLSIRAATVRIGPLNGLIGASGAGKTSFLRAFELLGRLADEESQHFLRPGETASDVVHHRHAKARLVLEGPSVAYEVVLGPGLGDKLIVSREMVGSYRTRRTRRHLSSQSDLLPGRSAGRPVSRVLKGCRVFRNDTWSIDEARIALRGLRSGSPEQVRAFERIVDAVRGVVPAVHEFVRMADGDPTRMNWRRVDSDGLFPLHRLPDVALRFLCLATLLLHPKPARLIILDEPELGLPPYAIGPLAGMLRDAATRAQVLFATQSVALASQFAPDELILTDWHRGASRFRRADSDELPRWLSAQTLDEIGDRIEVRGAGPAVEDARPPLRDAPPVEEGRPGGWLGRLRRLRRPVG